MPVASLFHKERRGDLCLMATDVAIVPVGILFVLSYVYKKGYDKAERVPKALVSKIISSFYPSIF